MQNRQISPNGTRRYFSMPSARYTLLFLIILTVINIASYLFTTAEETYYYFFCNISFPFDMVTLFDALGVEFAMPEMLYFGVGVAAVSLIVYTGLWFFAKKSRYVLLAVAIFYTLDLAELVLMCDIPSVLADIICHILVLVEFYGTFVMEGKQPSAESEYFVVEGEEPTAPVEEDPFAYARQPLEQNEPENTEE